MCVFVARVGKYQRHWTHHAGGPVCTSTYCLHCTIQRRRCWHEPQHHVWCKYIAICNVARCLTILVAVVDRGTPVQQVAHGGTVPTFGGLEAMTSYRCAHVSTTPAGCHLESTLLGGEEGAGAGTVCPRSVSANQFTRLLRVVFPTCKDQRCALNIVRRIDRSLSDWVRGGAGVAPSADFNVSRHAVTCHLSNAGHCHHSNAGH